MAKAFDPRTLFATEFHRFDRAKQPYPSEEDGFDGVKAGRKSMEMTSAAISDVTGARTDLEHWINEALARDLALTLVRGRSPMLAEPDQPILIYATKPDQLWRVPAMLAVDATAREFGPWTDATENLVSHLLGYTRVQRKKWIASRRQARAAWSASTLFAVLDATQRARVESVGRRCFGEAEALAGFKVLWARHGVHTAALGRLPKGLTLARVGATSESVQVLFGRFATISPDSSVAERVLTKKTAATLNAGLVSNVQFLTKRGWV